MLGNTAGPSSRLGRGRTSAKAPGARQLPCAMICRLKPLTIEVEQLGSETASPTVRPARASAIGPSGSGLSSVRGAAEQAAKATRRAEEARTFICMALP
jgi:hypothetical protein